MSTVQLPVNSHAIDMVYRMLDHMRTCKLWGVLVIKNRLCSPLWPEFGVSQRPRYILQSTHQGAVVTSECGVCFGQDEWCPKWMSIYMSITCTVLASMKHLVTVWTASSDSMFRRFRKLPNTLQFSLGGVLVQSISSSICKTWRMWTSVNEADRMTKF